MGYVRQFVHGGWKIVVEDDDRVAYGVNPLKSWRTPAMRLRPPEP
jgi:hypothetical protein